MDLSELQRRTYAEKNQKAFEKKKSCWKNPRKFWTESLLNKIIARNEILVMMNIQKQQAARNQQGLKARNQEL